ncbi:hypothetical protein [Rhizobium oryzicola]|uniref:Uncharacterized protein n=1 Tax=Rhizobium oryzicola TaxID=1232668 RepID=A0ABT8SUC5_9HYPH|nr:hypothetical protein [Rhizobium oryzicola]MDO1581643.1 hypothetical protein [Rhizobium oryzicola]
MTVAQARSRQTIARIAAAALLISATNGFASPAFALSDTAIQPAASDSQSAPAAPAAPQPNAASPAKPQAEGQANEIIHDINKLPEAVRKTRAAIVEAAASGDLERLRPLFGSGPNSAEILSAQDGDQLELIKSFSGDPDGLEILAIMLDVLQTGAAHVGIGTPDEAYVWPYFVGKPLDTLTAPEKVELLRIVTAGDLLGMQEAGGYNFYRLGIAPDGHWKYFASGD